MIADYLDGGLLADFHYRHPLDQAATVLVVVVKAVSGRYDDLRIVELLQCEGQTIDHFIHD